MKKLSSLSIALAAVCIFTLTAQAKIFRLNYPGQPRTGVDYTDYNTLQTAASNGDTVQIYGAAGGINVSKGLVFIGFGYNVGDKNPNLQAINTQSPSTATIYFRAGSSGSKVTGMSGTIYFYESTNAAAVLSDYVIERFQGLVYFYNYNTWGTYQNISIFSSAIYGGCIASGAGSKPVTGIGIFNSIISSSNGGITLYNPGTTAVIQNCVGGYPSYFLAANDASVLVENSIVGTHTPGENTVYNNCIFTNAPAGITGVGNQTNKARADIFTRNGGTDDQVGDFYYSAKYDEDYFRLKAGSPALGAGKIGTTTVDCGIFGGSPAYYFRNGSVPAVPSIYQLSAPGTEASTNPYNVTISVRANN